MRHGWEKRSQSFFEDVQRGKAGVVNNAVRIKADVVVGEGGVRESCSSECFVNAQLYMYGTDVFISRDTKIRLSHPNTPSIEPGSTRRK